MTKKKAVELTLYRYAGKYLFFRIKKRCKECDISYVILQRLMTEQLHRKPVSLRIVPWLDNFWKIIWRGGWHAPILTVNGKVFSQGRVPEIPKLLSKIGEILNDTSLIQPGEMQTEKATSAYKESEIIVYFSPACPHCRQLLEYLGSNGIKYSGRDVTISESARQDVERLTGRLTIPVVVIKGEIIKGFDRKRLKNLLGISADDEKPVKLDSRNIIPHFTDTQLSKIYQKAKNVLEKNQLKGWTMPSNRLYPHLWNWDSGFISRGYLHYDPERAYTEIRSLFRGQWSDGFLPHIIFNPEYTHHFPGPDYWNADNSGKVPSGIFTSGISQPPVHATMIVDSVKLDPNKERALSFLKEIYPKLKKLHDFYFTWRDPEAENLVSIVHPWESGLDNAPLWDEPLAAITDTSEWALSMQEKYDEIAKQGERPKRTYIEKYSYLIENLYKNNYDWKKISENHPFIIQGVLFNSILCKSELDLGKMAETLGYDASIHYERADKIKTAINKKLFDETEGIYYNFDLKHQRHIKRDTIFSYMPLFAGIPDKDMGEVVLDTLRTHCFCIADMDCVAIPSYDMCQVDFEGEFYWRGPVWVNINWYIAQGIRQYGEAELSEWIENSLIALADRYGFYEYYDPDSGKGLGEKDFSWTAALIIDLIAQKLRSEN
jgi:glycogen debranching enzyme/glutaredoxin